MVSSRRELLSMTSTAVTGFLVGCLDTAETGRIDITVSNASDMSISYEVSVEAFEQTGTIEAGGSDQYENGLDQPGSSRQFDVSATFETRAADAERPAPDNESNKSASDKKRRRTDQFDRPIDVDPDVSALSITYTGGGMDVNSVSITEDS